MLQQPNRSIGTRPAGVEKQQLQPHASAHWAQPIGSSGSVKLSYASAVAVAIRGVIT